jgi:hypothetical protein
MPPIQGQPNRNAWLADELANLIAGSTGLTLGTNMFVGEYPEENVDGVPLSDGLYLIELPGPMGKDEDLYLDTETHLFDLWSTSSDTKTAYSLLHRAYDILERKANYALVNWYVYLSYANSTIRDEDRSREGNKLFSLGVTVICRNLNNIS